MGFDLKQKDLHIISRSDWEKLGEAHFGSDRKGWTFACPVCNAPQAAYDFDDIKVDFDKQLGFSCIGRSIPGSRDAFEGKGDGPCNYTGGGLFNFNPVLVLPDDVELSLGNQKKGNRVFDFAPESDAYTQFQFLRYNPRRNQRGAPACEIAIGDRSVHGKGIEHWQRLWMSQKDLTKNMRLYGPRTAFLRGLRCYQANAEIQ